MVVYRAGQGINGERKRGTGWEDVAGRCAALGKRDAGAQWLLRKAGAGSGLVDSWPTVLHGLPYD